MPLFSRLALFGAFFSLLTVSAACTPTIATRGNKMDPEKLALVHVGTSSRDDVMSALGTPTQVGAFDENVWYYFGQTTEQYSFLDPEVVNREAYEIRFDENGIVKSLDKLDPDNARDVQIVDRKTPTYGHETTFIEQLVGNLGSSGVRPKSGSPKN